MKKIAVKAALEAGKYAIKRVGRLKEISQKSGRTDLVTDVDKKCEGMIVEKIKKEFPSHSMLAEEGGEYGRKAEYQWIIDPLDGTTNYAHTFPVFCFSIALMTKEQVRLGVVYDPTREELFTAEEGKGAFLNKKRIKVSNTKELGYSLLATGFAYNIEGKLQNLDYFTKMIKSAQAVRRLGSAALDLCYVACGRLDGFWELGLKPWDTAAGQLLVKEAGGKITAIDGKTFDIYGDDIVASNGYFHEEFLSKLNNI
ncbi:MAG: inositol monophosphatase family protein [Candidatus Omnitrophota bacterium]